MIKKLTSKNKDYSKWYNELVVMANLAENSSVRGCMIIKPYGYAIWEKMQHYLDKMFKETLLKIIALKMHIFPHDYRGRCNLMYSFRCQKLVDQEYICYL